METFVGNSNGISAAHAAVEAIRRGFQPVPLRGGSKNPGLAEWTRLRWQATPEGLAEASEKFAAWAEEGMDNVGVLLGSPSGDLIDVDLDHPRANRLKEYFLPPTAMRSGRAGRPNSHWWYWAEAGTMPTTRRYKMQKNEDGSQGPVSVELRTNGSQTVVPPSKHPSGQSYEWYGKPWGGDEGPRRVHGQALSVQVASLALTSVLLDSWPQAGSRHEAYLALAGGLLRYGERGVHPAWAKNLPVIITALAEVTHDDDGPQARVREVMESTQRSLREGKPTTGFRRLSEIIGERHVEQARLIVRMIEKEAGWPASGPRSEQASPDIVLDADDAEAEARAHFDEELADTGGLDEEGNPLDERGDTTWVPISLERYLSGEVKQAQPSILRRDDGQALMYPGRLNMLYGSSETAKSWISMHACIQVMNDPTLADDDQAARGARVMYLDFEDTPETTVERLRLLGAGDDQIREQFIYVHPEHPLAPMQRNRYGDDASDSKGKLNDVAFQAALASLDPKLIVVDGLSVLYGLHGLDTDSTSQTDTITGWLKGLSREGKSTVIIIDHTTKTAEKGTLPIGSQHKQAMVQGSMIQVWPVTQPRPGDKGEMQLIVVKDRPGQVRAISKKGAGNGKVQLAALIYLDSRPIDDKGRMQTGTTLTILPPPEAASSQHSHKMDFSDSRDAMRAMRAKEAEDAVLFAFGGEVGRKLRHSDIWSYVQRYNDGLDPENRISEVATRNAEKRLVPAWLSEDGKGPSFGYVLDVGEGGYENDPLPAEDAGDAGESSLDSDSSSDQA